MSDRPDSQKTIGNSTLFELEQLIKNIAKKTVQKEMTIAKQNNEQLFFDTFGTWKNEKTETEIIKEIYSSRNNSSNSSLI